MDLRLKGVAWRRHHQSWPSTRTSMTLWTLQTFEMQYVNAYFDCDAIQKLRLAVSRRMGYAIEKVVGNVSRWILEYIKKREMNELARPILLWKQKVSSPPFR
jgi:hypothetical protein